MKIVKFTGIKKHYIYIYTHTKLYKEDRSNIVFFFFYFSLFRKENADQ